MSREPTTLYLVRHGESEANAAQIYAGQVDSPLTERGRGQAEAVADALRELRVDRVVSSDLSRARDTASAIARRHLRAVECFRELREIDLGAMAGRPFEDVRRAPGWTDDAFVQWPGGESLEAVLRRSLGVVDRLVAESPGQNIVIVGHGGVTRILVSRFLGLLPRLDRTRGTNTTITKVVSDGITYRVEQLFDDAHLS